MEKHKYGYYRLVFGHSDYYDQRDWLLNHGVDVSSDSRYVFTERPKSRRTDRQNWKELMRKAKYPDEIYVPYLECLGRNLQIITNEIVDLTNRRIKVTINNYQYDSNSKNGQTNLKNLKYFADFQQMVNFEGVNDTKKKTGKKGGRPSKLSPEKYDEFIATYKLHGLEQTAQIFKMSKSSVRNYLHKVQNEQ